MAKCVVHLKKIAGMGLGGVRNHMNRTGVSRTNPDIDAARSIQNYSPAGYTNADHLEKRINERIKQLHLKKAVRKDAVRLVDVVVTSSRDGMESMGEMGKRQFFKDAADFLLARFGAENVVYANVHRDEAVDHMHFGFVPITKDGRLAAKSILTQKSLRELQTDFWQQVGQRYGLDRGEMLQTPRKHIETERFKADQASKISDEKAGLIEKGKVTRREVNAVRFRAKKKNGWFFEDPYYKVAVKDFARLQEIAETGSLAVEEYLAMKVAVEKARAKTKQAKMDAEQAQQAQEAAEHRAAVAVTEKEQVSEEAAPLLDAPPEAGRKLALQALKWARDTFRATYDTVARRAARAVVLRQESIKSVAARYSQPLKELAVRMEAKHFVKLAAESMEKQLVKHKRPKDPVGAGWIVHPGAVDYLARDASADVLAAVLSPAAVAVLQDQDDGSQDLKKAAEKLQPHSR